MTITQLLKLPGYFVALILGRPTGLAFAYFNHIPLLIAAALAPIVLAAWTSWWMARGTQVLNFACRRHNRWSRKLAQRVEAHKVEQLSRKRTSLIVLLGVAPTVGFWAAISVATACTANADPKVQQRLAQRLALLIAGTNTAIFASTLLLARHLPTLSPQVSAALETISLPLIGLVAGYKLMRHLQPKIRLHHPRLKLAMLQLMRITGLL